MIVFGCAVTDREKFDSIAMRGIRRVAEPDSVIVTCDDRESIQEPYNEIMDAAGSRQDLEALVLVHQDLELLDDSLLRRARPLLAQPGVGVVGLFGARRAPLHCWSKAEELFGRATTPPIDIHHSSGPFEVEVVDGSLLVIAPWAVRTIRFSEILADDFHGYDVDFCCRVRAAGGRVVCDDVPYMHHMERPWTDSAAVSRAGWNVARIWDPALRPAARTSAFSASDPPGASRDEAVR
jgi:GT2 family glycosyltransferase